ncbi:RimJ/RimL family protein N-acetyltransferase [Pseudonocardia sediminis]|uniref:RimJ/RimL family protein N-acetyltransferase n=1 Tax=Pseudonocardia sediminis TaxID=1397368 RepID=A0A4Q7UT64_PSEST|nr:GNAT family N-acetyltransferase [Pseudonocardia sediminis]RZT83971.1 RimJ/RimL family protein N-acetyltransferase [Pseudonocardia sediminis]
MPRYPAELRTGRLRLTRTSRADRDALVALDLDPSQHPFSTPPTPRQARAAVRGHRIHWWRHGFGCWTVRTRDGGPVVGLGGLTLASDGTRHLLNLGYRLHPAVRGLGLATELSRRALEHAAAAGPGLPIVVLTHPSNEPAARIAERLGFAPDHPEHGRVLCYRLSPT